MEKKKASINPKKSDGRCFEYAMTAALNHDQYEWKEVI